MNTAVIIGRFQTPYLHDGYKKLINEAIEDNDRLIIFITETNDFPSLKNPYDVSIRYNMLKDYINKLFFKNYILASIKDNSSDHVWSIKLDEIIYALSYTDTVRIYHSRDSIKKHYFGKYPLINVKCKGDFNSTDIRNKVINEPMVIDTQEAREAYLFGLAKGLRKTDKLVEAIRDAK